MLEFVPDAFYSKVCAYGFQIPFYYASFSDL